MMKTRATKQLDIKQENGCQTKPGKALLSGRVTFRLSDEMKSQWQRDADRQGIDLGALIRQAMENRRVRSTAAVKSDDLKHLKRLALWSVRFLERLGARLERASLDERDATDLQAALDTLLALFAGVADGKIEEEVAPAEPDASEPINP